MHQIFFPTVVFGVHVDDLSYSAEGVEQEEVVGLLLQVHTKVQEGMRDQVELMVSHPKTAALASTQELADKIAVAIGIPAGVAMCKKLGVDYRLFRGGLGTPTSTKQKEGRARVKAKVSKKPRTRGRTSRVKQEQKQVASRREQRP